MITTNARKKEGRVEMARAAKTLSLRHLAPPGFVKPGRSVNLIGDGGLARKRGERGRATLLPVLNITL
jgi:hypothetical protein